ncbi:MAG: CO dehydrogenase/CO-methylating acetyl-CoA synthase complex subunit beta [Candidatus Bathyarchaeota archaeon]|nr:CO dehydrogenase/CO-methylating acetyl-CoA synthase complex subunit beta [Candidatus Bathyarchaeota archaeon]MDH5419260.1 CO dehydrogenase/CO-methylating acetyl-CoA synthase complex subunit beta [Candidatus Bathyarchaeota archaeon]MDH5623146.1 CO dehydrogenase/CO-methylating acetyl-CoA synthase complex subunit beta [Candidatus Bathyarchaeota archaeon]MDH5635070.1 CO dehydrogenase/CO-methylating acetyl-CoA synthase complex subunit beta [Candidatus Bathyarchaeota archaeon]MDH5701634.1 CO dehyd
MFEGIPVEVGVIYEGERIRRKDMYVELGGPEQETKFELVRAKGLDEVEDEKITVIGPDIKDVKEGSSIPLGIYVEVAGKDVEEELEGVIERRIHEYCNFIEGLMHLNQRYDIWLRLNKKSFQKGLNSFNYIGKVLTKLYKSELPFIEKIQITFITDPDKVRGMWKEALSIYEARDAKARGMKDEEVDAFYGCTLCQSFAPTHVCVITPQRYSNCGSISWFDGRASARVDPKGPVFAIEKGEMIDTEKGEYSGVNEVVKKKSLGAVNRVWLYTGFGYPHTSCGCFEAVAFYIPEVDGFGIVDRGFKDVTVNGLPFSTLADSTAGGRQIDGFHGISVEYMRSPKFLQVDGGWNRIVWMPSSVKERVKDFIPKEVVDKIATENDSKTVDELRAFLKDHEHPVVQQWKEVPVEAAPEVEEALAASTIPLSTTAIAAGGFKIILKNAKIHAEKLIIKREKAKR